MDTPEFGRDIKISRGKYFQAVEDGKQKRHIQNLIIVVQIMKRLPSMLKLFSLTSGLIMVRMIMKNYMREINFYLKVDNIVHFKENFVQ